MKKLIALLLVLVFVLSFATVFTACGDDTNNSAEDDEDDGDDDGNKVGTDPTDPTDPESPAPIDDLQAAKNAVTTLINIFFNGDKTGLPTLVPEIVWERFAEGADCTKADLMSHYDNYSQSMIQSLVSQVGANVAVTYQLNSSEDCPADKLISLCEWLQESYSWELPETTQAYFMNITLFCKGDVGELTEEYNFIVFCHNDLWYVAEYKEISNHSYAHLMGEFILSSLSATEKSS